MEKVLSKEMRIDMKNVKFAIFGDCGSHGIVDDREHTRAVGFVNWYSLLSHPIVDKKILDIIDNIEMSRYSIRNLSLDLKKTVLQYLLEEKAEYLLIDPNDCRMEIANIDEKCYTISNAGGELYDKLSENKENVNRISADKIPLEEYERAAIMVCRQIKETYDISKIILHEHNFVDEYTDGNRILKLHNERYPDRKKDVQDRLKQIYEIVRRELYGCHIIEFPDYVLADSRHRFGLCGLHYHNLYYEYGKKAIQIICEKSQDEKLLLCYLRKEYSLKFQLLRKQIENDYRISIMETRLNNLVRATAKNIPEKNLKDIFQSIADIRSYVDAIHLYMHNIGILIAVKDTPGYIRCDNCHEELNNIGFKKYPDKLWCTYCGLILQGVTIIDLPSEVAETATVWSGTIHDHDIHLESHSWREQNVSKILIDGVEYSTNIRGANIVIINAETFEVLDSVVYDTHESSDYFRRINKV